MVVAAQWYASGTLWTAVGAAVTLLVGVGTATVTYMVGFPRRRLLYGVRSQAPLLAMPDGTSSVLELRHRGRVLTDPHVVEIVLASRGRRDVPRSAFDNGAPIRLDLGVHVIELLQITTDTSNSTPTPQISLDGSAVTVGPGLIGRRQKISVAALVEGEPALICEAPLADVSVGRYSPGDPDLFPLWMVAAAWVIPAFWIVAWITVWTLDVSEWMPPVAAATSLIGAVMMTVVAWWMRRRS